MPSSVTALGQARSSGPGMASSACCCSPAAVQRRLPILAWLPNYSLQWLKMDFIAGLSVGLTAIPQALAYAEVAGLPPQYGLYSAFVGCFVYFFLGTSRDVTLGPTAIMSLLVSFYTFHEPAYAVLLAFLSGCIQLAMGVLHLGFLLDFISCPVIKGFTSAATVTIGFGQIKNLLGLQNIPRQFFLQVYHTFLRIAETRVGDAVLGLVCMLLLLVLKLMRDHMPPVHPEMPLGVRLSHGLVWSATTASQNNYRVDANQELLAIGLTNVLGSFVSSYPVTGSFGRTAVNSQSGVCTPAGGLVTGVLVLLSLDYLTSLFYYIPKSALAAIIIMAVAPLFDTKIFRTLWRVKRSTEWVHLADLAFSGQPQQVARTGPAAPVRDLPAVLLGGAVRHPGRGPGVSAHAPALRSQARDQGVRGAGSGPAASQRPVVPRHGGSAGGDPKPGPGSLPATLPGPGVHPCLQHRLHRGAGAWRAPPGLPEAGRRPGLRGPAGPCSPCPAVR
ncbi:sodium-independent sulfate anion transporter isoform X6 [Macaca mulatta]